MASRLGWGDPAPRVGTAALAAAPQLQKRQQDEESLVCTSKRVQRRTCAPLYGVRSLIGNTQEG